MYCVKCGVSLKEGIKDCPLCGTPVWNPNGDVDMSHSYPERVPQILDARRKMAVILTFPAIVGVLVLLIVWMNLGVGEHWGGISLLGIALGYIAIVLPLWFKKFHLYILNAIVHAAAAGYTLYICYITNGHWFLSFAFPVLAVHCLLSTALFVLLHYIKGANCFILGGSTIAYGLFTILIEFFAHISFGQKMFNWSLYSAGGAFAVGMFLIIVGIIKPLRNYLQKILFF